MRFARHIQRTTLAIGLAWSLSSCVDQRACEACIDEQTELRIELIEMGLEPAGSLESAEYYRGACTQKVIALDRPCGPAPSHCSFWRLASVEWLGACAGGKRRRRSRSGASQLIRVERVRRVTVMGT